MDSHDLATCRKPRRVLSAVEQKVYLFTQPEALALEQSFVVMQVKAIAFSCLPQHLLARV